MYEYNGKVIGVPTPDRVTVQVKLGFDIIICEIVHLFGLDVPSKRERDINGRRVSRERLRSLILNKEIIVKTYKLENGDTTEKPKYMADLYLETPQGLLCVNDWMVEQNLAKYSETKVAV